MRLRPLSGALFAGLLMLSPALARSAPLKITDGWANAPNTMTPILFLKKDLLKHYGVSYVVEATRFSGTPAEVTALAAGEPDIATLAVGSFAAAVVNGGMQDLRVIGDGFQDGAHGSFSTRYLVRNDSGIKTIEDLKGKVVASNGVGGAVDMAMRAMLAQHHLMPGRDYSDIEARFAALNAMLAERKVALIGDVVPFAYDSKVQEIAHVLFTMQDAVGPSQMIVLAARKGFLDANRPALTDFFEDMERSLHWFLDPRNHEAAVAIIAAFTKRPAASYADWVLTAKDFYHAPDIRPNVAAMQHEIETERRLGFLKADLDIKRYVDLGFVDAAAARQ